MGQYILAIDQGTTGTTAALVDAKSFRFVDKVNQEFPQIYPRPGHVEHNLNDIWNSTQNTIQKVLEKSNARAEEIVAIGVTNQRETTCAFDKSGRPLFNAIVWQDRRTGPRCEQLKKDGLDKKISHKTGLTVDPYFSATKMQWMLENVDSVKTALSKSDLLFGNIDTFLIYKLTGNKSFVTEASNASRTLLMNLETVEWDKELLEIFKVPLESLPEIKDSFGVFGKTQGLSFLPDGIPIAGVLGDQQSALFGQAAFNPGEMKCTYGTGSFLLVNTGTTLKRSSSGILSTAAYRHHGKTHYALEGSCYIAGAAVQWLRDNLGIIGSSPEIESLAGKAKNHEELEHLLFLPFFTGIASPYWKSDAKAAIVGITRDTKDHHIARACLDGVAMSINDLIRSLKNDLDFDIKDLRVDGGASENNLFMQIQSNVSNLEIIRPKVIETTAYGAALGAAVGIGQLDLKDIKKYWEEDKLFKPEQNEVEFYQKKIEQWDRTIKRLYL